MAYSEITIEGDALRHNLERLYELSGSKALFPVIKANAYGHGLIQIGKFFESQFDSQKVPYFCVARYSEAKALRSAGVNRRILVMSEFSDENLIGPGLADVDFVVSRFEDFDLLASSRQKPSGFHLNINTGMNRLGFDFRRLDQNMDLLTLKILSLAAKGWVWSGLMTHLARGEEEISVFSQTQNERFQQASSLLKSRLVSRGISWPKWTHISNSGGILRGVARDAGVNASRPGIHLWGAFADFRDKGNFDFRPALKCGAEIRQVRLVPKGDAVGYGEKFTCSVDRIIGTVNLGYADGIPRILSRRANAQWKLGLVVNGIRVPFVGVISMDMVMIDLSDHPQFKNLGEGPFPQGVKAYWICPEQRSEEIAEVLGTIPYEVFCSLSQRLRREVVGE